MPFVQNCLYKAQLVYTFVKKNTGLHVSKKQNMLNLQSTNSYWLVLWVIRTCGFWTISWRIALWTYLLMLLMVLETKTNIIFPWYMMEFDVFSRHIVFFWKKEQLRQLPLLHNAYAHFWSFWSQYVKYFQLYGLRKPMIQPIWSFTELCKTRICAFWD
jgi:hypothetical protein